MPISLPPRDKYVVGVISDTHGLMRAEALCALSGADLIIHAGDIGRPEVLEALRAHAPAVVAVRGNNDGGASSRRSSLLSVLGVTLPTILACTLVYKFSAPEVNKIIRAFRGWTVFCDERELH